MTLVLLTVSIEAEHDLVLVRQRTRQLAEQLGVGATEQTRLATAVSEISRNAYQYAQGGRVEFLIEKTPKPRFLIRISDAGPGIAQLDNILEGRYRSETGLGKGLMGARRLVDYFEINTLEDSGTEVVMGIDLPAAAVDRQDLLEVVDTLTRTSPGNPFGEVLQQNQELLQAQSQLATANRELEAAQEAKDHFLAMLGHELRNLLNALRSALEVLDRADDAGLRQRMQGLAQLQVVHLERLIDDLLDASRIVRGTLEVQRQPVELGAEVELIVTSWRERLVTSGIALEMDRPEDKVWISADRTRLAQILGNLISNSTKFTDSGGMIRVRVGRADDFATLEVIDSGCGVEPDQLHRIFEPFAQTSGARKRMTGGLGLGLAIVQALTRAHEGEIEACSEGLGTGLSVRLRLPTSEPPPPETDRATPGGEADPSKDPPDRCRVLLVDDHEASVTGLSELLRLDGHEVEVALDGPSALEAFERSTPEIVFCDLGLPGMDGLEVARRLVARDSSARLVAVSGFADRKTRQRALKAGFEDLLPKPIDLETLETWIEKARGGGNSGKAP